MVMFSWKLIFSTGIQDLIISLSAPFFIKHLPKTIDVMEGIDVRLDCILRRGIELIRWSSSRSPSQERDKERQLKKELKDAGFSGEFIPLETAADSSRPSADERKTGGVVKQTKKKKWRESWSCASLGLVDLETCT